MRLFKPSSLVEAFNLACEVEDIVNMGTQKFGQIGGSYSSPKPFFVNTKGHNTYATVGGTIPASPSIKKPMRALSQAEKEDRRKKGLCSWCASKYTPGHKCVRSQLYQLVIDVAAEVENDQKSPTSDDFQDCLEKLESVEREVDSGPPILSLHALNGSQGHNTMRLLARIGNADVIMLVDSGSTHNFVDCRLVKQLHLSVDVSNKLRVMVANGAQLATLGVCRGLQWESQGQVFVTDFMVLPIKGCDLVLDVQWLLALGPITWNFASLTIQFEYLGRHALFEVFFLEGYK